MQVQTVNNQITFRGGRSYVVTAGIKPLSTQVVARLLGSRQAPNLEMAKSLEKQNFAIGVFSGSERKVNEIISDLREWPAHLDVPCKRPIFNGTLAMLTTRHFPGNVVFTKNTYNREILLGEDEYTIGGAVKNLAERAANAGKKIVAVLRKDTRYDIKVDVPKGTEDIVGFLEKEHGFKFLVEHPDNSRNVLCASLRLNNPFLDKVIYGVRTSKNELFRTDTYGGINKDNLRKGMNNLLCSCVTMDGKLKIYEALENRFPIGTSASNALFLGENPFQNC